MTGPSDASPPAPPLARFALAYVPLAVALTGGCLYLAFSPEHSGSVAFWALALSPTVALAVVAAVWAAREDYLREWLSPRWGDFTRGVLAAVALFMAGWGVTRVLAPVGSPHEIWLVSLYGQIGDPRTLREHGVLVGAAILVAAFAEELVWRGAVTQMLAERVGSRMAWVWAAGLYALAMAPTALALGGPGGANPMLVIAALGAGLVWGGMVRVFGTLPPAILAHALFDWAVLMMFPFWGPGR